MEGLVLRQLLQEVAARCPGRTLPDTYVVIDSETTGVDAFSASALQYGLTFVENRKRIGSVSVYIRRSPDLYIHPRAIELHGITHEKLAAVGVEPHLFLPEMYQVLHKWRAKGAMMLGHNLLAFDTHLITRDFKELGLHFVFGENEIIDTGMLVKAAQLSMFFSDDDTLSSFYRRVSATCKKGVFWALDRHCYEAYGLAASGISRESAHDAGVDCDLAHYLFEQLRIMAAQEVK